MSLYLVPGLVLALGMFGIEYAWSGDLEQKCLDNKSSNASELVNCYRMEMDEIRWKRKRIEIINDFIVYTRGRLNGEAQTYKCSEDKLPALARGGRCASAWNRYVEARRAYYDGHCDEQLFKSDPRLMARAAYFEKARLSYESCFSSVVEEERGKQRFGDAFLTTGITSYRSFKEAYRKGPRDFKEKKLAAEFGDLARGCNKVLKQLDAATIRRQDLSCN